MWRQQNGALLEIMSEDDDRWYGYLDGVAVGEGPDLKFVIDLVMAATPFDRRGVMRLNPSLESNHQERQ